VRAEPKVVIAGIAELSPAEVLECGNPVSANSVAIAAAARDAGVPLERLDAVLTYDSLISPDIMQANRIADYLGITLSYASTIGAGGATPAFMVAVATSLIKAGLAETIAIGHSDLRSATGPSAGVIRQMASVVGNPQFEDPFGPMMPTLYSLLAGWMIEAGHGTREDLAAIAVQIRAWAALNPNARMRSPLTLEEVVQAPSVAGVLGRYDCCLITDFAGALIVSSGSGGGNAPKVIGASGSASHEEISQIDPDNPLRAAVAIAAHLYESAGITAGDVDLAYLYDSFTITVALQLLSFGLTEGASLSQLLSGAGIGPGGRLPVNTHGGLMSSTTSGIFHLIEAVRQLRGDAGPRQVDSPRIALVNNVGGAFSNHCAILLEAAHGG
jgi:acetyl-CoA acetyltransferase